jgi:OOP family OmpA-OmpF porin
MRGQVMMPSKRVTPRGLFMILGLFGGLASAPVDLAAEDASLRPHDVMLAQRVTKPGEPPPPAPPPPDTQPRQGVVEPPTPGAAAPPTSPPAAKPGPTAPPPPIELARVAFAANSATLSRDARAILDKLAATLKTRAEMRALVKAYSGAGTSVSETRRLSLQRGTAVRNYLVEKGIAAKRIDVQPLGNSADAGPVDRVDIVQSKP